jgi:hypothetical protein
MTSTHHAPSDPIVPYAARISPRGVNFTSCFVDFRNNANQTLNSTGLLSATGGQVANVISDILNATGFTYRTCLEVCGSHTETPNWANIFPQFGA